MRIYHQCKELLISGHFSTPSSSSCPSYLSKCFVNRFLVTESMKIWDITELLAIAATNSPSCQHDSTKLIGGWILIFVRYEISIRSVAH